MLLSIVIILILIVICIILFGQEKCLISEKMQDVIITITPNKDKKMINQVADIISKIKDNKSTTINSVYRVKDIRDMEIEISVSPYGTAYSDESYITNFNGIYYASFDNGQQKVSGNENALKFSELDLLNQKSEYVVKEDEAKLLIKKSLKNKYDIEVEVENIYANSDILGFNGYGAKVKILDDKNPNVIDVKIEKDGKILDNYYDFLIGDEYKKLIVENISKIDNKVKIIGFSNTLTHPYGDEVYKGLSLEDALIKEVISKKLSIITYTDLSDEKVEQIEHTLKSINYIGSVVIYKTDKKTYSEVDSLSIYNGVSYSLNPKLENAQEFRLSLYD